MTDQHLLTKEDITAALTLLGKRLSERGIEGRIYVVGGAAIALAFDSRRSTRDIDAVFEPKMLVLAIASDVGEELGLPADWINDGAKGFVPGADPNALPVFSAPGVEVTAASAETLLAMKLLASRVEQDTGDIELLARVLRLTTAKQVLDVARSRYGGDLILPRTRFLVESVFGREVPA